MAEQIIKAEKLDVGIDSTNQSDKVVWSTGRNVRFTPGYVSKTLGKTLAGTLPTASLTIREMFTFMGYAGNIYTIICTDAKIYVANGDLSTFTDITPAIAPTGGASDYWEFTIVAGLPILTNGKDMIWKWASTSSILTPLLNAPLAKHISCSMHRLVLSNIYSNGVWYSGDVVWSEMGNPENFTIDTSKKSGKFTLSNYQDGKDIQHNIVAQAVNGSEVLFFTERNVWKTDFAQSIKQFVIIANDFEVLSPRSVTVKSGIVYAAEKRDIYAFTGNQKSALDVPIRTSLYTGINSNALNSAFSFSMQGTNEIWFCVSTGTNTNPDTAYIYNYELNNWTILDCDFICHSTSYAPPYIAWINNSGAVVTWTNNSTTVLKWAASHYNTLAKDITGDTASHVLQMDSGFNSISMALASTAIYGVIESGDMAFADRSKEKIIRQLFPEIASQTQTNSLMIQVGARDNLSMPIQWSPVISFKIGQDNYADLSSYTSYGGFIRIRFYTNIADSPWSLSSYSLIYNEGRKIR